MTYNTTIRRFKILGVCDNINECDCCGKTELQKTVAIENLENGEIKYFGTTCAMQPAKGFEFEKKEMNKVISDFKRKQQRVWSKARVIYKAEGGKFEPIMEMHPVLKTMGVVGLRVADTARFDQICKEFGNIQTI